MKRFNLTVTRLSGYTVDAESAEEAVDLVLGGEVEENGEETVDHTVEEVVGPDPDKVAKLRSFLEESYIVFEANVKNDLARVGIPDNQIEDIVTRLMEEADLDTLLKVASENF